jgi:hypothetical protein
MPTVNQIYKTLEALSDRYVRLRKKFGDFFELAGYLSSGRSEIRGISLEGHLDENYFIVTFCGLILEFRFSIAIENNGDSKGVVSCYAADPVSSSQRILVTRFTYAETGATDVQKPEDIKDLISLDTNVGAVFLVCYCLHNALTR